MTVTTGGAAGYVADVDQYGDAYAHLNEHVPALRYPYSLDVFSKMRRDSQVAAVQAAYMLPIRRAQWAVDGRGCRPEVAQMVAADLDLMLIGGDDTPQGARRRGVQWADHLRMALLSLTYGHMLFEPVYDVTSGQARLIALEERLPQTIERFVTDTNGRLVRVEQKALAGIDPIRLGPERVQLYTNDREGSAYQGTSLLRAAYKPWLLKDEMLRVHATSNRRHGVGVPYVKAPANAQPNQIAEAQRLAQSWNASPTGGVGLPAGFEAGIMGASGSLPDTLGFIQYLDQQMTRSTLTGLLDLGSTEHGSRALGDTFLDLLMFSLQTIADGIAAQLTAQTVMNMVTFNFGENEPVPRVVAGSIGAEHAVTAEALAALLSSGALGADPALEEYVRREWKLPERQADTGGGSIYAYDLEYGTVTINDRRAQLGLPPMEGGDVPPAPPASQVAAAKGHLRSRRPFVVSAAANGLRREPTAIEAASGADFPEIQDQWATALDELVTAWGAVTTAQRKVITAQISKAVDAGDREALASLAPPTDEAAALLAEYMEALAEDAGQGVADEGDRQGVSVTPKGGDPDRISGASAAVAGFLAAGLASSAGRAALQAWGPDASAKVVVDAVNTHLDSLTESSLRDGLGSGLSIAQNEGRVATLADAPTATYYASEILDANTCGPCGGIDGTEFASLEEAQAAYASGGYVECDGGLRCRGVIVSVWS